MDANAVYNFLNRDRMRHLVQLKYLHVYGDALTQFFVEDGANVGFMLAYLPRLVPWDNASYSDAEVVLLPTAATPQAAEALCALVEQHYGDLNRFIFKFCDDVTQTVFANAFELHYIKATISYTTEQSPVDQLPDDVVIANQLVDEAVLELYGRNGYPRAEVAKYFADSAWAFTIYEASAPVCSCLAYRNFDDVYEIGALHTVEAARGKGYARRVVQAALLTLLSRGLTPRYQIKENNAVSQRLAESLGLRLCLRFEHYHGQPKR